MESLLVITALLAEIRSFSELGYLIYDRRNHSWNHPRPGYRSSIWSNVTWMINALAWLVYGIVWLNSWVVMFQASMILVISMIFILLSVSYGIINDKARNRELIESLLPAEQSDPVEDSYMNQSSN
jgi:hypothetical protein